jgi:multidrug efflux system outer membrane protein
MRKNGLRGPHGDERTMNLMRFKAGIIISTASMVFFLTGCMLGPDFEPPLVEMPQKYRFASAEGDIAVNLKWWQLFQDPVLYSLVTTALTNNRDIWIAASRIEEARLALGFSRADLYPAIDLNAGGIVGNFSGGARSATTNSTLFIAPAINWEVDFWGKVRRANESAQAELFASTYALRTVQLSLISEVVSNYYLLLDFHNRLEISKMTLASRVESLDIIQQRFEAGLIPELDLNQAEIQKEVAAAAVPLYERLIAQAENTLGILLGGYSREIQVATSLDRQPDPPEIPVGLPADLLERRPDIIEALYLLEAQSAKIGFAQALRFPAISLTGKLGLASTEIGDLTIEGGVWSLGGGILGPIFNFGKNIRRVEIEEERTRQALYRFENTVLKAFRDVENALVEVQTYSKQIDAVGKKRAAAKNAEALARERYDAGYTSYLEALDAERTLFSVELEYSDLKRQFLNAYVKLYKALGGGWLTEAEMNAAVE